MIKRPFWSIDLIGWLKYSRGRACAIAGRELTRRFAKAFALAVFQDAICMAVPGRPAMGEHERGWADEHGMAQSRTLHVARHRHVRRRPACRPHGPAGHSL